MPQRPMTDREMECIMMLRGKGVSNWLSIHFSHPRLNMRKALLIDYTMACLGVTKSFDNDDVVKVAVKILHEPASRFGGASPYKYGSLSNLHFGYASGDIKSRLSEKMGQKIVLPDNYLNVVNTKLSQIRTFLGTEQLREVFFK